MHAIALGEPLVEPVSTADLRAYLRLDDTAEDALLAALAKAARQHVEAASGRVLVEQPWRLVLDGWPVGHVVASPVSPLLAVDRVRITDATGALLEAPSSAFRLDASTDPPLIVADALLPDAGVVSGGIEIEVRAGFGASAAAVPEPLRQAVRLLVARWFEHRGDEDRGPPPPDVAALIHPYRRARL